MGNDPFYHTTIIKWRISCNMTAVTLLVKKKQILSCSLTTSSTRNNDNAFSEFRNTLYIIRGLSFCRIRNLFEFQRSKMYGVSIESHWLIDWLIDWLVDWLIDWLSDWYIYRLMGINVHAARYFFTLVIFWKNIVLSWSRITINQ